MAKKQKTEIATELKELKKAIALRYKPEEDQAPIVVGTGQGKIAEQIIALAKEHNITIHKDSDLVEILSALDPGDEIPLETYTVVAEILSFIYKANDSL